MGPTQLGYYGFAREILGLTRRLLVLPLTRVALPAIAYLGPEPGRLREPLIRGIQILMLLTLPGSMGILIVAPDLVPLLVGSEWVPAVAAVQIGMLLGPIMPVTRLSITLQLALGKPRSIAGLAALGTAIFIALLCVPKYWTVEIVLTAFVVRSYLLLPLHLALVQHLTGITPLTLLRGLTPVLASCLTMVAAVLVVRGLLPADMATFWRFVVSLGIGLVVYATALIIGARPLLAEVVQMFSGAFGTILPRRG
jgi:O-antigen/teichoic acid export membrane protein